MQPTLWPLPSTRRSSSTSRSGPRPNSTSSRPSAGIRRSWTCTASTPTCSKSLGEYNLAIQEYDRAIAITPKLTFLYLRAGANYRQLGFNSPNDVTQKQLFEKSLEYFARAASINEELQVDDPTPYLSISKTYSQQGEYFIAARNVQRALEFQPDNADFYGQLGVIYFKSRNYEGSIPALQCAVLGCAGRGLLCGPRSGWLRRSASARSGHGLAADAGFPGLLPGLLLGPGSPRAA